MADPGWKAPIPNITVGTSQYPAIPFRLQTKEMLKLCRAEPFNVYGPLRTRKASLEHHRFEQEAKVPVDRCSCGKGTQPVAPQCFVGGLRIG